MTFISKSDLLINRTQHFVECLPHAKSTGPCCHWHSCEDDTSISHRFFLFEWFTVAHIIITQFIKQLRVYSLCHKLHQKDPGRALFSHLCRNRCFLSESEAKQHERNRKGYDDLARGHSWFRVQDSQLQILLFPLKRIPEPLRKQRDRPHPSWGPWLKKQLRKLPCGRAAARSWTRKGLLERTINNHDQGEG